MFITKELLQSKEACRDGIKLFIKLFPNGAEFDDEFIAILAENDVPTGFIWWFYDNIQQDKRLHGLCGVNQSNGVSWSNGVSRSNGVHWSFGVRGSDGVSGSNGISGSNGVHWSFGVSESDGVNRSNGISRGDGASGSFGLLNCRGMHNSIFCINDTGKNKVFGIDAGEERANEIIRRLYNVLNSWRPTFNNLKALYIAHGSDWKLTPVKNAAEIQKKEAWADMPKAAIGYIRSLPEFDAAMFEEITAIKTVQE